MFPNDVRSVRILRYSDGLNFRILLLLPAADGVSPGMIVRNGLVWHKFKTHQPGHDVWHSPFLLISVMENTEHRRLPDLQSGIAEREAPGSCKASQNLRAPGRRVIAVSAGDHFEPAIILQLVPDRSGDVRRLHSDFFVREWEGMWGL